MRLKSSLPDTRSALLGEVGDAAGLQPLLLRRAQIAALRFSPFRALRGVDQTAAVLQAGLAVAVLAVIAASGMKTQSVPDAIFDDPTLAALYDPVWTSAVFEAQRTAVETAVVDETQRDGAIETIEAREQGAQVRARAAGRLGRLMEPVLAPLGMDWRVGVGILGAFAAREVRAEAPVRTIRERDVAVEFERDGRIRAGVREVAGRQRLHRHGKRLPHLALQEAIAHDDVARYQLLPRTHLLPFPGHDAIGSAIFHGGARGGRIQRRHHDGGA